MKNILSKRFRCKFALIAAAFALLGLLSGCADMNPHNVDVELQQSNVEVKITSYTQALRDLGMMSEIYGAAPVKIQSNPIGDNTGTSGTTGGEIPRDITEILKSTLNTIGGQVTFIPYDPAFIQNQMVTGYSNFDQKLIPDVVISGGITEFDRGLETRGKGTDAGAEADFTGMPDWLPSQKVGIDYSDSGKTGLARITLDFNLLDFTTMAGIARMNTVNSLEVHKGLKEKEFGITLFGPTFGMKGSIKKVEGRHAAVRLLVEASMLQMVGKYLVLPYWRVMGEDAQPDQVVMNEVSKQFYSMSEPQRVAKLQEMLFLYGHTLNVTGTLDPQTVSALQQVVPGFDAASKSLDEDTYTQVYLSVPIESSTLGRRQLLAQMTPSAPAPAPARRVVQAPAEQPVQQAAAAAAPQQQQAAAPQPQAAQRQPEPEPQPKAAPKKTSHTVGRMLTDDQW